MLLRTENYGKLILLISHEFFEAMYVFLELVKDIWEFMKIRKKYWLAPLIVTIVLMGGLIIVTQGSVVAPFIYSIF